MLFGLGNISVRVMHSVDESNITFVVLRLFIHEREDTRCACHTHDYRVDLLRYLVYISGKLLRHAEERHKNIHRKNSDSADDAAYSDIRYL